ncbi:MAG: hypothetical protein K2P78_12485 [Gemmataceae bacterium]|nr:hypothetical protein [Gemmataceae bacterium]
MMKHLLQRRPFRMFTVQLMSGERLQIDHPDAVATKFGIALFIGPGKVIHEFDHNSVLQLVDESAETTA